MTSKPPNQPTGSQPGILIPEPLGLHIDRPSQLKIHSLQKTRFNYVWGSPLNVFKVHYTPS